MADRRRRRRPTASESEYSETDEKNTPKKELGETKKDSDCESEDDHEEGSEYESATEENEEDDFTYTEDYSEDDSSVLIEDEYIEDDWVSQERQSGDGEEQPDIDQELDDDEDRKNPAFVPRKGNFYEHDRREDEEQELPEGEEIIEGSNQQPEDKRSINKKKLWEETKKWDHDRYDDRMQAPKSREELIALYGYDIRASDKPPEDLPVNRGKPRGRRSDNVPRFGDYMEGRFENSRVPRYGPKAFPRGRGRGSDGPRGRGGRGGRGMSRGRPPPNRDRYEERGQGDRRAYSDFKSERNRNDSGNYDHQYSQNYRSYNNDHESSYQRGQSDYNQEYSSDNRRRRQDGVGSGRFSDRRTPTRDDRRQYNNTQDRNNRYEDRRNDNTYRKDNRNFSNDVRQDPRYGNKNNYGSEQHNSNDNRNNDRRSKSKTPERKLTPTGKTGASLENIMDIAPPLTTIETRTKATVHTAIADDGKKAYSQDRRKKGMRSRMEDDRPESQKKGREMPEKPPRFREQEQAKQQVNRGGFGQQPTGVTTSTTQLNMAKQDGRQTKRYSSQRQRNVPESDNQTPPPQPQAVTMTVQVSQPQVSVSATQMQGKMPHAATQPRMQGPQTNVSVVAMQGNPGIVSAPVQVAAARGQAVTTGPRLTPQYFVQQQTGQVFPAGAMYRVVAPPNVSEPQSPPTTVKSYPHPHLLQQQAMALQAGAAQMAPNIPQARMIYSPQAPRPQGPPQQSIALPTVTGAPRVVGQQSNRPQFIAAPPIVNIAAGPQAAPPPSGTTHFPIAGQVPVQFPVPPPPPVVQRGAEVATVTASIPGVGQGQIQLPPPPSAPQGQIAVAQGQIPAGTQIQGQIPGQTLPPGPGQPPAIHVRGGTTYFNPQIQMIIEGRSPARRTKEPIPIVSPQGTPERPGSDGEFYETSESFQYEAIQQQYDAQYAAYLQQYSEAMYAAAAEGQGQLNKSSDMKEEDDNSDGAIAAKSSSLENILKQSGSLDNIKEFHPQGNVGITMKTESSGGEVEEVEENVDGNFEQTEQLEDIENEAREDSFEEDLDDSFNINDDDDDNINVIINNDEVNSSISEKIVQNESQILEETIQKEELHTHSSNEGISCTEVVESNQSEDTATEVSNVGDNDSETNVENIESRTCSENNENETNVGNSEINIENKIEINIENKIETVEEAVDTELVSASEQGNENETNVGNNESETDVGNNESESNIENKIETVEEVVDNELVSASEKGNDSIVLSTENVDDNVKNEEHITSEEESDSEQFFEVETETLDNEASEDLITTEEGIHIDVQTEEPKKIEIEQLETDLHEKCAVNNEETENENLGNKNETVDVSECEKSKTSSVEVKSELQTEEGDSNSGS